MLFFKSQNLVVGLFTESLSVIGQVVKLLDLFNCVVYLTNVTLVNSGLVAKLFPPNVNIASQNLVLSLKIIVLGESCLQLVFKKLYFMLIFSHLGSGWPDGFEHLLLLGKLFSQFLLLITKNHHVSKFKQWTVTEEQRQKNVLIQTRVD